MIITLSVLIISAIFFAIGKFRSDIVALCALTMLLLTDILTPQEALAGFSNPVVLMMVGLFVIGGAILQTGIASTASSRIMTLAGSKQLLLFVLVMVVTAFIGAFVSNTGTVALMMPIAVSLAQRTGIKASRLLMPLAFASSMGGMLTLIGTPPNLVIQEALVDGGYQPLGFFSFLPVGIVCIVVGIVMLYPLSARFLKGDTQHSTDADSAAVKSIDTLAAEYRLNDNLFVFTLPEGCRANGITLGELNLHHTYGITVMEIRHIRQGASKLMRDVRQKLAGPQTVLRTGDTVLLSGTINRCNTFAHDYGLTPVDTTTKTSTTQDTLAFYDIGIAEVVTMTGCRTNGKTLSDIGLRRQYNINVLSVKRGKKYIANDLATLQLHSGDVLLIQGKWSNIAKLSKEDGMVVIGQPLDEAAKVTLDYKAPTAAILLLLMVLFMVIDAIPVAPVTTVMLVALLMVISGCLRSVEQAYKTINWESIVLIAAMLPMSTALEKTGASQLVADALATNLGNAGPYALLAGIYFTTSLLTLFISNTATAVLMAPIALGAATTLHISPYPMLFGVTLGASMCFASPFSTPPNALVMNAGGYSFADYIKVGLPLQIILGAIMIGMLPLLFPF